MPMTGADNARLQIKVYLLRCEVFTAVNVKVTKEYNLLGCDAV
jgi:hypothetical protein